MIQSYELSVSVKGMPIKQAQKALSNWGEPLKIKKIDNIGGCITWEGVIDNTDTMSMAELHEDIYSALKAINSDALIYTSWELSITDSFGDKGRWLLGEETNER